MSSQRLRGKVLAPLAGRSVLSWVVRAAAAAECFDAIVVATSGDPSDNLVAAEGERSGAVVYRGDLDDVLTRFVGALGDWPPEATVVRLTADCPLLDPAIMRSAVGAFEAMEVDYLSTIRIRTLPRGLDVEVFRKSALLKADAMASGYQRVHVTPAIYENPGIFNVAGLTFEPRAADLRVTIDTQEDLEAVQAIVVELGDRPPAWRELVRLLRNRPDIVAINSSVMQKGAEEG